MLVALLCRAFVNLQRGSILFGAHGTLNANEAAVRGGNLPSAFALPLRKTLLCSINRPFRSHILFGL